MPTCAASGERAALGRGRAHRGLERHGLVACLPAALRTKPTRHSPALPSPAAARRRRRPSARAGRSTLMSRTATMMGRPPLVGVLGGPGQGCACRRLQGRFGNGACGCRVGRIGHIKAEKVPDPGETISWQHRSVELWETWSRAPSCAHLAIPCAHPLCCPVLQARTATCRRAWPTTPSSSGRTTPLTTPSSR